jgi:hypothetical protein
MTTTAMMATVVMMVVMMTATATVAAATMTATNASMVTALTDDGTAAPERVPSENFNMQKTGPVWRGDRKENL